MGYRKAAMLRRSQYVRGHYRTNSKGESYWVEGHCRNEVQDNRESRLSKTAGFMIWWGMLGFLLCAGLSGGHVPLFLLFYVLGFVLLGWICHDWVGCAPDGKPEKTIDDLQFEMEAEARGLIERKR